MRLVDGNHKMIDLHVRGSPVYKNRHAIRIHCIIAIIASTKLINHIMLSTIKYSLIYSINHINETTAILQVNLHEPFESYTMELENRTIFIFIKFL